MTDTAWKTWPQVAGPQAQALLSLQQEFAAFETLAPAQMRLRQNEALENLLSQAAREVPHYRAMLKRIGYKPQAPFSEEMWLRIPVLKRTDLRDLGQRLMAKTYPSAFGGTAFAASGGSTGVPVRVLKTAFEGQLWEGVSLREEIWHRDHIGGKIANLRGVSSEAFAQIAKLPNVQRLAGGLVMPDWGEPYAKLWKTGPMGVLQPGKPVAEQIDFLEAYGPDYLLLRPSSLRLLIAEYRARGMRRALRAVWTMSETVDDDLRAACQDVFGCRIVSNYSASEAGYIALQCPDGTGYHALSDIIRVEVLDPSGHPVAVGERGRVVVTPLYAYAMPLIRYEIGDEAIAGAGCGCGRTLPHIAAIVGRLQNYFLLRDGTKLRVDLSHYRLSAIARLREFQLAQTGYEDVELRLCVFGSLDEEEQGVVARVVKGIPPQFRVKVVYPDQLPRTPAGKLLQFVREF